jgi:uncharacterized membrane protein YgdD (TMEM256/DUF423 family)
MTTATNDTHQHDLRWWGGLFGLLGASAVILGAFGAHGLENTLTADSLDAYKTGVQYQFIHVLAALVSMSLLRTQPGRLLKLTLVFQLLGIVFFSGSIYLLSTQSLTGLDWPFLGPITPIGGVFFIVSWLTLAYALIKSYA